MCVCVCVCVCVIYMHACLCMDMTSIIGSFSMWCVCVCVCVTGPLHRAGRAEEGRCDAGESIPLHEGSQQRDARAAGMCVYVQYEMLCRVCRPIDDILFIHACIGQNPRSGSEKSQTFTAIIHTATRV
jgi:hypothetical protein